MGIRATSNGSDADFWLGLCTADGKTFKKPRRPYEKERLDAELKLVGEYGLRNKRELWRVQMVLSKIRNAARVLLTLDEKDPKRIFEGNALMRRMNRYGLLNESQDKLDYVLALTPQVSRRARRQRCTPLKALLSAYQPEKFNRGVFGRVRGRRAHRTGLAGAWRSEHAAQSRKSGVARGNVRY